jgi:hypothetical protein
MGRNGKKLMKIEGNGARYEARGEGEDGERWGGSVDR